MGAHDYWDLPLAPSPSCGAKLQAPTPPPESTERCSEQSVIIRRMPPRPQLHHTLHIQPPVSLIPLASHLRSLAPHSMLLTCL